MTNARKELERIIGKMRFSQKGGWGWEYDNKEIAQAILDKLPELVEVDKKTIEKILCGLDYELKNSWVETQKTLAHTIALAKPIRVKKNEHKSNV